MRSLFLTALENGWITAGIIAAVVVVTLYILLIWVSLRSLFYFKKKMNKIRDALVVLLSEKFEILQQILDDFGDEYFHDLIIDFEDALAEFSDENIMNTFERFTIIENQVFKVLNEMEDSEENKNYNNKYSAFVSENASSYRSKVEEYNYCLLGYNYWHKFVLTKPFVLLFRFKEMKPL